MPGRAFWWECPLMKPCLPPPVPDVIPLDWLALATGFWFLVLWFYVKWVNSVERRLNNK